MVSKAESLIKLLSSRLAPLGDFRARAMFGGHGLYLDDVFFALIAYGRLYLKVDEQNRADYIKAGSKPFTYTSKTGQGVSMSYYECPGKVLRESDLLQLWAKNSLAAARRKKKSPPRRSARKRSANPFL